MEVFINIEDNSSVSAIQWDGNDQTFLAIKSFCGDIIAFHSTFDPGPGVWYLYDEKGTSVVHPFDWIVKDKNYKFTVVSSKDFSIKYKEEIVGKDS